jgi:hypothetical protein
VHCRTTRDEALRSLCYGAIGASVTGVLFVLLFMGSSLA